MRVVAKKRTIIAVERCGCDAAFRGASSSPLALLLVVALTCAMIGANR